MLSIVHPLDLVMTDAMMLNALPGCRFDTTQPRLADHGKDYALVVSAPGVKPTDLCIETSGGQLTVKGETVTSALTHFVNFTVALPSDADPDAATATSADGLLEVRLPKKAKAEPISIAVSTHAPTEEAESTTSDDVLASSRPYKLTVVAPGVAPTDLDIRADASAGLLTVHGETERTGATISRKFRLPRDADAARASATCVDGLLQVSVPKRPAAAGRVRLVVNGAPVEQKHEQEEAEEHEDAEDGVVV